MDHLSLTHLPLVEIRYPDHLGSVADRRTPIRAFQRTSPRRRIPHDIAVRAHRNRELLLVIHRRRIVHFDTGQPCIRTVECRFVDVGDLHQIRAQGNDGGIENRRFARAVFTDDHRHPIATAIGASIAFCLDGAIAIAIGAIVRHIREGDRQVGEHAVIMQG